MRFLWVLPFVLLACGSNEPAPRTAASPASDANSNTAATQADATKTTPGTGTASGADAKGSTTSSAGTAGSTSPTSSTAAEHDALRAAEAWLAGTDAGKYKESWAGAAPLLRNAIDEAGWTKALTSARAPLGATKSRSLRSSTFAKKLPGAPDGEYVVLQFETEFASNHAIETVTPMKDADGQWRVAGYFVKRQ